MFDKLRQLDNKYDLLRARMEEPETYSDPAVYAAAAAGNGRFALMVANPSGRDVEVAFKGLPAECSCLLTDREKTYEAVSVPNVMPANSFAVIVRQQPRKP